MTFLFTIGFFLGGFVGSVGTIHFIKYLAKRESNKISNKYQKIFSEIFENRNLSFKQRINNYVLMDCPPYNLVYMLDKKHLMVLENDHCIAHSSEIDEVKVKSYIKMIEEQFSAEINQNTISFFGYTVSKSMIPDYLRPLVNTPEEKKENIIYTVDEILEKIHEKGINSLTPEELDFLNKNSK
jgi:hypothetical protein